MSLRFIFLSFVLFVSLVGVSPAQSGRTKPTPRPTPVRSIAGPSVLSTPVPQPTSPAVKPTPSRKGDDEVIRVDSILVPIPVSVTEADGRPAVTLRLEDFELKIDGKKADIAELSRAETPIRLAMLFDNSSSVMIARDFEREAAVRFFRRVIRPDRDMAALFTVADYTRLEQAFTRDVALLTQAISFIPEPKGATALLDGIIEVADYLRVANGRRVLVIVSDGEDTYSDMRITLESVIKRLQMSDCQVYVVMTKEFENFKRTGGRKGNANIQALAAERRMFEIAEQTGGMVHSPIDEDEMSAAFTRIAAELSQQYVLSYYPDETADKKGEFRSISVAVKSKRPMTVRARKGYYVGK